MFTGPKAASAIPLSTAVGQIKSEIDRRARQYPFFFMIGAGVSSPVIPTAAEIVNDCRQRNPTIDVPPSGANEYTWCVEKAFPSIQDRATYFSDLMANKALSRSNRLLAIALQKHLFGKLVLTTNFDDQVERAIAVLGGHCAVIDAPEATYQLNSTQLFPTILYLHGKFVFQDLVHSSEDGRKRSDSAVLGLGTPSIRDRLCDLMMSRSPLVIGYSGALQDVFLDALQDALEKRKPGGPPVYWFCYRGDAPEKIPAGLRNHIDFRLVVADNGVLPASTALKALISAVSPEALLSETHWRLPSIDDCASKDSFQQFLESASQIHLPEIEPEEMVQLGEQLLVCYNNLDSPFQSSAVNLALTIAEKLISAQPTDFQHRLLLLRSLCANGQLRLLEAQYAESLSTLDRIKQAYAGETHPAFFNSMAAARFYRSYVLGKLGREDESEAEERECLDLFNSWKDAGIVGYTMMTASNLARTLIEKKTAESFAEGKRLVEWVQKVCPDPLDSHSGEAFARSLFVLADLHEYSGKYKSALAILNRVVNNRQQLREVGWDQLVELALVQRCDLLAQQKQYARSGQECTLLGRWFGIVKEVETRERITRDLVERKKTMLGLGFGWEKAPEDFAGISQIPGEAQSPELRAQLLRVLRMKTWHLLIQGRFEECLTSAEEVFRKFGLEPPDADLREEIVEVASIRLRAVAALIYRSMRDSEGLIPRDLVDTLITFAEPLKLRRLPEGFFFAAYGCFLRGQKEISLQEATQCGLGATDKRRAGLLKKLQFPEDVGFYNGPASGPLLPNQEKFSDWFQDVTRHIVPLERENVKHKVRKRKAATPVSG